MLKKINTLLFSALFLSACQTKPISPLADNVVINNQDAKKTNSMNLLNQKSDESISAVINTSLGQITLELFSQKAPLAVGNFIGLSNGTKIWTNPKTGQKSQDPLYQNLIFHRIIKDFMIQGGDPLGNGTGGPGYSFKDEFNQGLTFDKPGILAMANNGSDTNGSQFFITLAPTPWLNGKHTIFGQVIEGMDVVEKIGQVAVDEQNKPLEDVILNSITINQNETTRQ